MRAVGRGRRDGKCVCWPRTQGAHLRLVRWPNPRGPEVNLPLLRTGRSADGKRRARSPARTRGPTAHPPAHAHAPPPAGAAGDLGVADAAAEPRCISLEQRPGARMRLRAAGPAPREPLGDHEPGEPCTRAQSASNCAVAPPARASGLAAPPPTMATSTSTVDMPVALAAQFRARSPPTVPGAHGSTSARATRSAGRMHPGPSPSAPSRSPLQLAGRRGLALQ